MLADAEGLSRAITNLVENAAKYSPPHAPITNRVTTHGTRAELSVSDHGPGIPPAERTKVFERFYRGDPARAPGGAGLGLPIVAGIAADHHGQVRIDDNPGGGTTIVLDLPLAANGTGTHHATEHRSVPHDEP